MEPRESFWELHRKLADCYAHDMAEHRPSIQSDRRNSLQRRLSLQSVQVQKETSMASDNPKSPMSKTPMRMVSFDRNSTIKVIDFDQVAERFHVSEALHMFPYCDLHLGYSTCALQ